jgi:hypothetical protein
MKFLVLARIGLCAALLSSCCAFMAPAIPDTCTHLYSTRSTSQVATEEKSEITENVLDEQAEDIGVSIEDKQMIIPEIEAPYFAAEVSPGASLLLRSQKLRLQEAELQVRRLEAELKVNKKEMTTRLAFKDDELIALRGVERENCRDRDEQLKQRDETIEKFKSDQGSVRKLTKQAVHLIKQRVKRIGGRK